MANGRKTGGGSRKGKPNKTTSALKDMILAALSDAGGVEYLRDVAKKNPGAFLTLLGKVLPTTLTGPDGKELPSFNVNVQFGPQPAGQPEPVESERPPAPPARVLQ